MLLPGNRCSSFLPPSAPSLFFLIDLFIQYTVYISCIIHGLDKLISYKASASRVIIDKMHVLKQFTVYWGMKGESNNLENGIKYVLEGNGWNREK